MADAVTAIADREQPLDGAVHLAAGQPAAIVAIDGASESTLVAALGDRARGAMPKPRRATRSGSVSVLWSGPGQWLLVDEREGGEDWHRRLREALDEDVGVTDLTHARVTISLQGERAVDVLLTGCSMDLAGMSAGDCAVTRLAHFHVMIECAGPDRFRVFVTRSFALAAWDWLLRARSEFES